MMDTRKTAARIAIDGVAKRKLPGPRNQPPEQIVIDHGADGPAALARQRSLVKVATGNTRQGREQAEAIRYRDGDPWLHYENAGFLTERQVRAGRYLTRLYNAGFSAMLALPAYGISGASSLSEEEDAARSAARREYGRLADLIPYSCQHAMACMVRYEFPRMANRIFYVREACDVIAEFLELPREGA